MLIVRLFRFLFGYVQFTAGGGFPERFINLCTNGRITLWGITCRDSTLTACTSVLDYRRIRQPARRAGMKMHIMKKCGLPFFLKKRENRMGLFAGAALSVAALFILSTRIWSITVIGNQTVPARQITDVLESYGLKIGAPASGISAASFQMEALERLPELQWIYVNVMGCKAYVEVREIHKKEEPEEYPLCDLVSSSDGTLTTLRVFDGTPCVKEGSAVLKGDILISGIEAGRLGDMLCGAKGYAEAQTILSLKADAGSSELFTRQSRVKTTRALEFFSLTLPLRRRTLPGTVCFKESRFLFLNQTKLPFGVSIYRSYQSREKAARLNKDAAPLLAFARLMEQAERELRYAEIQSADITVYTVGNTAAAKGTFRALQNIGIMRPMELQDTGEVPAAGEDNTPD